MAFIAIVSGSQSRESQWTSPGVEGTWWESPRLTRSTTSSQIVFYLLEYLSSSIHFREFLECIPDVIFFQDCIQEEDITDVLNEVSWNGYKIHFQVKVCFWVKKQNDTFSILHKAGTSWEAREGQRKYWFKKRKRRWRGRGGEKRKRRRKAATSPHRDCLEQWKIFWDSASGEKSWLQNSPSLISKCRVVMFSVTTKRCQWVFISHELFKNNKFHSNFRLILAQGWWVLCQ